MAHPTRSAPQVAIPLPSDAAVRRVIGKSYDPERTLNVIKMFAGTEEMFDATIGLVKAISTHRVSTRRRAKSIFICARCHCVGRAIRMASQHSDG